MNKVLKTKKDLGHSMVKFQKISTLSALIGLLISLLIVFGCSAGEIQNMIYVEGGTFQMGSDNWDFTKPVHEVTVPSFYIGKYEVTQKEWETVMTDNKNDISTKPYTIRGNPQAPIIHVTWYDAIVFCNRKSIQEGLNPCYEKSGESNPDYWGVPKSGNNDVNWDAIKCNWEVNGYRLPTEAEWEYAAKGGNKSKDFIYSGSNNINEVASYVENSDDELRDAGTKEVNELGIYDMSGSAWEWCWDRYSNSYYSRSPKNAPKGTNSGSERVRRGGAWSSDEIVCRVVLRLSDSPGTSYNDLGFRVVRTKK